MDPIRDRGVIKWQSAMLLPEHVKELKNFYQEVYKVQKPILDAQQLSEMDILVREAMEFNTPLHFTFFEDGEHIKIKGYIHFINMNSKEYRIRDFQNTNHFIAFHKIIEIVNE